MLSNWGLRRYSSLRERIGETISALLSSTPLLSMKKLQKTDLLPSASLMNWGKVSQREVEAGKNREKVSSLEPYLILDYTPISYPW